MKMLAILLQLAAAATTIPVLWAEPVDPGRVVTRDDAIGLCATADAAATTEMDAMIGKGAPGPCEALSGTWRVTRRIADRCIGVEPGWYLDGRGRKHPATSCHVEAHVVEIRQGATIRLAMVAMTAEQLD